MMSIICSPNPMARMIGSATTIAPVSTTAPNNPPNSDAEKAAPKARAAWPCFDKGNPSTMVACELAVPGMPMRTEGKVSEVAVTDCRPIIIAKAYPGSMPKTNGNKSASPAVPPSPGRIPTISPRKTPKPR